MSHPFGDLLTQHLHRKHGLSQSKLAAGILQDPSVITEMCKGRRLTGPQARERVVAVIGWLHQQGALATETEANALLSAAGFSAMHEREPAEAMLLRSLGGMVKPGPIPIVSNGLVSHTPSSNLPPQPTPFVGRERELTEILQRLNDPACRLLTLLGMGGVGKSRLSLEAAQRLAPTAMLHGAHFVALASVDSFDGTVAAIARAVGFNFYAEVPARQQLLDYVREKQLLLILDNVEQLTSHASFFSEMLAYAPKLKLLVTSREALNLQEEWLYSVEGLALPAKDAADATESDAGASNAGASDALQLFAQCAKRARADFGTERDEACARHICALVEGMPLGIELAASWLRTLPCGQIARELERSLDILNTRLHNVPERHRNLRAVFEHSWQRLTGAEQAVLMRLAVLCRFRLEAAQQVGGATLPILAALVDKSLLRVVTGGRYQMHTLLRQLAEEKLRADAAAYTVTLAQHSTYYLAFVAERERRLLGAAQVQALDELAEESDNIRAAWERAVQRGDWAAIRSALQGLYWFYAMRVRFVEGEIAFALAAEALRPYQATQRALLGWVLARQGAFSITAGSYDTAKNLLDEALAFARAHNDVTEVAFVLNRQGHLAQIRGKWMAAISILEQSLHLSEQIGDERSMARTLFEMATVNIAGVGAWGKALALEQRNLALCRKLKLPQQIAYALEDLGTCSLFMGRYAEAKTYYEESLPMFRELGDWLGYAKALNGLGATIADADPTQWQTGVQHQAESIALLRKLGHRLQLCMHLKTISSLLVRAGQYQQARDYTAESIAISTELDDPIRIAYGYVTLAKIAMGLADFVLAKQHVRQGLLVSHKANLLATTSWLLTLWVRIWVNENANCTAANEDERMHHLVMLYVAVKDQVGRDVLDDGEPLIAQLEAELPAERVAEAKTRSTSLSLNAVVEAILQGEDDYSPRKI